MTRTLSEVREALARGESPQAIVRRSIDAIRAGDRDIGAFLHIADPGVAHGGRRMNPPPLSGVAIAVKDNILVAGLPATCGSRILDGFVPPDTATAVARLESAGAAVVGKTNLDEFAMGSSTEHSAFHPTRNPLDLERVPGGSSGGSAAAVAAGMVPIALGSDTGGSVRQPAAYCGIVGLKPTWGRVSRRGLVAFASSLDQIGILARSAADCAPVLAAMAGHDPLDSTSSSRPVDDYASRIGRGLEGRRFGVIGEALALLGAEERRALESALGAIRKGGGLVETVSVPLLTQAVAIYSIVANAEASANLARYDGVRFGEREGEGSLESMYVKSRSHGFGAEVKRRIMLGTFALSAGYYEAYYGRAQRARRALAAQLARAFTSVDILVTPTTPGPAFRLGEKLDDPLSMYLTDLFTVPANLAGLPAIAFPFGHAENGLPLSVQLMGRAWEEGGLIGAAVEIGS
ncbi:MAG: Asp-tRNA(Asn)/Glu-tRNA(Gln) amidotransferase subunit GatA [Thermoanaerobaculia bacterium]